MPQRKLGLAAKELPIAIECGGFEGKIPHQRRNGLKSGFRTIVP